jgi:pSer/pThr/pTyr-binding forkhead associated (FHA) protein
VRDLGSRNGTYVNGRKIGQRAEHQPPEAVNVQEFPAYSLHEGDEIKLGSALLRVHIAATPDQNNAEGVAQVGRPSPGVETPGEDGPAKSQPLTSRRPTTSRLRSVRMLWQSFCERFLQRWPWDRGGCKLAAR